VSVRAVSALVFLALVGCATRSRADAVERHRVLGLGTAGGGGFNAATVLSSTSKTPGSTNVVGVLTLPTLEGRFFLGASRWSVDVTLPVTNLVVVSAVVGGFFFNMDAFLAFNLGRGPLRLVVGPGLGLSAVSGKDVTGASLRIPAEIGAELLVFRENLGVALLARPWLEIAGGTSQAVGGGLTGVVGVFGYFTR
jgi:hypothetical protein